MIIKPNIQSILKKHQLIGIRALVYILPICITSSCQINKHLKEQDYLVEKSIIKYNGTPIEEAELNAFIRQKPNRKILKLVPFNLWLYQQVNQEKMVIYKAKRNAKYDQINAKRIKKNDAKNEKRRTKGKPLKEPKLKNKEKPSFRESLLEAGEAPVLLDTVLSTITTNQLQKFVYSRGYFNSTVTDSVVLHKKRKRAKLFYSVSTSKPYFIQNIHYHVEDPLIEYFIFNDTSACLIKRGAIYNEDVLENERERITENQLNNGYFHFAPEYIYYLVDTNVTGEFLNITIGVKKYARPYNETNDSLIYQNHPRVYIGNVYLIPESVKEFRGRANTISMADTLKYNNIHILHNFPLTIKRKLLSKAVTIEPGELYQQHKAEETYNELTSLKVFKSVFIQYLESPTQPDRLDCYILCQPFVKQSITIESEGTNTSGNLGVASSFVFQNKNALKGAELIELKLKGSLAAQKQFNSSQSNNISNVQNTFNTLQFGPELTIYFPRPLFPFTLFYYKTNASEKRYFTQPKTILNSSLNYQSRPEFNRIMTNISYGFKFTNSSRLMAYEITPFEIYSIKAKLYGTFENDLLALNDFFLLNSFQDHITTLSKFSAAYNNQTIAKKRNVMYLKTTVSASGNILRGLYDLTEQPKDQLGRYQILNIPFSQFVKLDVDYRFYFKIRKSAKLVSRFAGGIGKPLTNLSVLPYEQSFFSGGPNGIRAWRARTLGPGSYEAGKSSARYDKIGNIQLESNIEYRFRIFKSFYGAWFTDVGNIWLTYEDPNKPGGQFKPDRFYKEIAIGSGFGIRYDFSFFILRLDAAIKIRDPQYAETNRWTFDKQPVKGTVLNFGIGYPF